MSVENKNTEEAQEAQSVEATTPIVEAEASNNSAEATEAKGIIPAEAPPSEPNETEQEARRQGWRPKEEYEGDSRYWRPAAEFIERGKVIKENRNNELTELRNAVIFLTKKEVERESEIRAKVIKELSVQKKEAIRAGDEIKVEEIEQELDVHKKKLENVKNYDPEEAQINQWNEQNSWWANDHTPENKKMRNRGNLYYNEYLEEHPGDSKMTAITHAAEQIRKDYPHRFSAQSSVQISNQEPVRRSTVETSAINPTMSAGKKTYTLNDLPLERAEREALSRVILLTKTTEDAYIKRLIKDGRVKI